MAPHRTVELAVAGYLERIIVIGRNLLVCLVACWLFITPVGNAARLAAQHEKLVADDLGCVPILTVPILPFTGLEFAVEVDTLSFGQVLASYFCESCVEDDVVPLGAGLPFATFVLYLLTGRE